jgi:hypothetical protein
MHKVYSKYTEYDVSFSFLILGKDHNLHSRDIVMKKTIQHQMSTPLSHCANFVVLMTLQNFQIAGIHCKMSTWTRKKSLPSVSNPGFGHVTCAGLGRFEVWSDGRRGNGSCPQETNRKGSLMIWQAGHGRPVAGSALSDLSASIERLGNSSLDLLVKKANSMRNSVCCLCLLTILA